MFQFRNLKIINKISVPAMMIVVVSIGITLFATIAVTRLSDTMMALVDKNAARLHFALQAESKFNSAAVYEKNVIFHGTDAIGAAPNIELYDKETTATLAAIDHVATLTRAPDERALIETFRTAVGNRRQTSAHIFELAHAGKVDEAFVYSGEVAAPQRKIAEAAVGKLIAANVRSMEAARDDSVASAQATRAWLVAGAVVGLVCALGFLGWIALYQISLPLGRMTREMAKLAAGDIDLQLDDGVRADEVGALARALRVFRENAVIARRLEAEQREERQVKEQRAQAIETLMHGFEAKIGGLAKMLAGEAAEMQVTAHSMAAASDQTNRQSSAAAAAAEQASANVQTVAAATEELAASVREIGQQVMTSRDIARQAISESEATSETVQALAEGAQTIGGVVQLISSIAAQTNLLALNATIEAARAGDAGKGFAVVASEVKNLANQTTRATGDIEHQIGEIQAHTTKAVVAIGNIGRTIADMSDISMAIAAAIEEQGAATMEIARSVTEAARGTEEVSINVGNVHQASAATGAAADQILTASGNLSRQAEILNGEVGQFTAGIRSV